MDLDDSLTSPNADQPPPRYRGRANPDAVSDPSRIPGVSRPAIRVLPAAVAARIAAGETIERPASVVKELVENALDAGARTIRIDVRGGGLSLIRVGDDGTGIRAAELWLACQRHATSKLPATGLDGVLTLGFRGEALPAIAAVAELSITSAVDDQGVGWKLTLRDGQAIDDEPAPRGRGTTVTVRHLFHRLPARLAAARAQPETGQIGQIVRRLALSAPHVRLTLVVDDRLALQTTGADDLATTLLDLYGPALDDCLLTLGPIAVAGARCQGLVAGPETTRPGRSELNLIVNGRWVQPRSLLAQIETAYRPVLPRGRHPILALHVVIAPDQIDVNIHPAKLEVRLRDERTIGAALGELVRDALARRPLPLWPAPLTGAAALGHDAAIAEESVGYDDNAPIITPGLPPLRLIGQVRARLLLLEGEAGLYLVDQHRAHERVLYERLAAAELTGGPAPEPLALPEPLLLELSPAQVARFGRQLEQLAALGFVCERFGGHTFLLRAAPFLPGVVAGASPDPLAGLGELEGLLPSLLMLSDEIAGEGETWRDRLLVQLSCRTAVRRGKSLTFPAMRALVEQLGQTRAPAVCPHGSPLLMHVGADQLERQFGWR